MPAEGQTEQVTDHKAEALREARNCIDQIGGVNTNSSGELAPIAIALALVAIAEGQERVAEALESANQDRREQRASAVEELRELVREVLDGEAGSPGDWNPRARKTLALFEAADHV